MSTSTRTGSVAQVPDVPCSIGEHLGRPYLPEFGLERLVIQDGSKVSAAAG